MTLVVDTSALVALLLDEPLAAEITSELAKSETSVMSAATYVEAAIVIHSKLGPAGAQLLERIITQAQIDIVSLSVDAANEAINGWRTFGKGNHPAALNLGDCYTYGEATIRNADVLCVGDDFATTDLSTRP